MKKICRQAGVEDSGTKIDCVLRLRNKMNTRKVYDKVFSKIWGASGWYLLYSCLNCMVYSSFNFTFRWVAVSNLSPSSRLCFKISTKS